MNAPSDRVGWVEGREAHQRAWWASRPSTHPTRSAHLTRYWLWFRAKQRGLRAGEQPSPPVFALARPRRMKKSARAVLLWGLIFYALSGLLLTILMDRRPAAFERVYRMKWANLCRLTEEEPDRPLVVMLGSSRADDAFQAGRLDGLPDADGRPIAAYNFAVPASGPIHEYLYFRQMLARGIRPRLLLVEFLPPLFNDPHSRYISEERWLVPEWVSASHLLQMAPYHVHPLHTGEAWIKARLAPWSVYREALRDRLYNRRDWSDFVAPQPNPYDRWGFCPSGPVTARQLAKRTAGALVYVPTLKHFRRGEGPTRAMRDLLACCRRERIPVALLLTPESTFFRGWYPPECLATMGKLLEDLRAAYGVEVIDARQWLDDGDFMDGHHVLEHGAQTFTTRLLADVRRIFAPRR